MDDESFESFRKNAEKNRMFIRAAERMQLSAEHTKQVDDAMTRSRRAHEEISKVQNEFESANIPFVIFKTLSNHPDMGLDVDFLVAGKDFRRARDVVIEKLGGKVVAQSMGSTLAGKVSLSIEDSPITVEIHGGGFSQIGEYAIDAESVIKKSRIVKLFDMEFRVPSPEDGLLIDVIHRIYRHMSIRYSDAYNTRKLLDEEKLDWAYIVGEADHMGVIPGLVLFLRISTENGGDIENLSAFPYYVGKMDFFRDYVGKLASDFRHLRFASLVRMVTLYPALLLLEKAFGRHLKNTFW